MLSTSTIVIGAFAGFVSLSIPTSSHAGDAVKTDPATTACTALTKLDAATLPNKTIVISSARTNAAAATSASPALPEHCEVIALALGYAVVSQDSGHDNTINNNPLMNGAQTFGFDPQSRLDLGYQSYDLVTQTAKALIRAYYGKPPEKSYYVGCSEGGREGLMMSQRFPEHFDGILAVGPGINIPKTITASAWDTQALAAVAKEHGHRDRSGQVAGSIQRDRKYRGCGELRV